MASHSNFAHLKITKYLSRMLLFLPFAGSNSLTLAPQHPIIHFILNLDNISETMSNRAFCSDKNVVNVYCPIWQPVATCDDYEFKI